VHSSQCTSTPIHGNRNNVIWPRELAPRIVIRWIARYVLFSTVDALRCGDERVFNSIFYQFHADGCTRNIWNDETGPQFYLNSQRSRRLNAVRNVLRKNSVVCLSLCDVICCCRWFHLFVRSVSFCTVFSPRSDFFTPAVPVTVTVHCVCCVARSSALRCVSLPILLETELNAVLCGCNHATKE